MSSFSSSPSQSAVQPQQLAQPMAPMQPPVQQSGFMQPGMHQPMMMTQQPMVMQGGQPQVVVVGQQQPGQVIMMQPGQQVMMAQQPATSASSIASRP